VAERHAESKNKRDVLRVLSNDYGRDDDVVVVKGLDAKGLIDTVGQLSASSRCGVGTFVRMLRIQVRIVWCFDGRAVVGARTLVPGVWFRGG
jgi:hypothetical protein